MRIAITVSFLFLSCHCFAETMPDAYLQRFLKVFSEDSSLAMDLIPPKYDSLGRLAKTSKNVPIEAKDAGRKFYCGTAGPGENCQPPRLYPVTEISGNSDLKNFFYSEKIKTSMEDSSGTVAMTATNQPWSGDYWPTFKIGIAARYNDPTYPSSLDFTQYKEFFEKSWPVDLQNQEVINQLSPAEKYDLLLGLQERPLAQSIFEDAFQTYTHHDNNIETWFGLCHGWAPASIMSLRPRKAVEVQSVIPHLKILFYPDDIKALSSHLWANTPFSHRVMGGRCNDKNPPRDENGRVISEDCYDINPGSWHLAIYNQIAVKKKSFVMDATYDYQVWNQPVVGYKMTFFNPETNETSPTFETSMIESSSYGKDPFKKYRSPKTAFVVGVSMEVTYVIELHANSDLTDDESQDALQTVQYIYDLEIDAQGKIIGGEWYQNAHPDFIWAPDDNARAVSVAERALIGTWEGTTAPPEIWETPARFAARYGQPLASIVENLIRISQ